MRYGHRLLLTGAVVGVLLWFGAGVALGSYTVTATCSSGGATSACSSRWYTSNVAISWSWSPNDGGNPTSGCVPHSYAQDTSTSVSCTVQGPSGGGSATQPINLETSSPTASATPSRPPDLNGWYNHPVAFSFSGSSFSGIASCAPPTTYAGPDSTAASVSGSCTDNAGKTASATSAAIPYDASAPTISAAAATGDGIATLLWASVGDVDPLVSVEVVRSPGRKHHRSSVLYRSNGSAYSDTHVRDRVRYRYTIVATDLAGNTSTRTLTIVPGPHLLAPLAGALVTAPPQLLWTRVRKADYYNVQLFRGGRKILSAWPATSGLQLRSQWRFEGRRYRLKPGRYKWYVWPGYGRRSAAHYGRMVGSRTFVVPRG